MRDPVERRAPAQRAGHEVYDQYVEDRCGCRLPPDVGDTPRTGHPQLLCHDRHRIGELLESLLEVVLVHEGTREGATLGVVAQFRERAEDAADLRVEHGEAERGQRHGGDDAPEQRLGEGGRVFLVAPEHESPCAEEGISTGAPLAIPMATPCGGTSSRPKSNVRATTPSAPGMLSSSCLNAATARSLR